MTVESGFWASSRTIVLVVAALGVVAACGDSGNGDSGDDDLRHEGVIDCLEDAGLSVEEGGLLAGKPGIAVEGGSVLIVVFDSPADAESEADDETGFWAQGETDARGKAFVYVASGASDNTRDGVDSCVPPE